MSYDLTTVTLHLENPARKAAFTAVIQGLMEDCLAGRHGLDRDMARPYKTILEKLEKSDTIELFGGFLECAKSALRGAKNPETQDICQKLLEELVQLESKAREGEQDKSLEDCERE